MPTPRIKAPTAAVLTFLGYAAAALLVPPVYPFASATPFSQIAPRNGGAVPVLLVGGEEVDVSRLDHIAGLCEAHLTGRSVSRAALPTLERTRTWLREHAAPRGAVHPTQVPVELGWRRYGTDERGRVVDLGVEVVATGSAVVQ